MRADLRYIHTPDTADMTLEGFEPPRPDHFAVFVQAMIGPLDEPGEESFGFTICSPSWISDASHRPKGFEFVRHTLVLDRWDPEVARRAIADLCRRTTGPTWNEIGTALSRYGHWEFEDYID